MSVSTFKQRICCLGMITALSIPSFNVYAENNSDAFERAADTLFWDIINASPVNHHYSFSFSENSKDINAPMLGSFSNSFDDSLDILKQAKQNLALVDFNSLTAKQKQVFRQMKEYIDISIDYCKLPDYGNTLGPMSGILPSLNTIITEYYLLSENDVNDYIRLLEDVPRFLNDILAEIDYQESLGYSPSLYSYEQALENRLSMTSINSHPYLEAFLSNLSECDLPAETAAGYTERVKTVITDSVIPAFSSFYDSLELKKTSADESKGLCFYEHGKDYYALIVRDNTGTDMSPLELKDYLMDKLDDGLDSLSHDYLANPNLFEDIEALTAPVTDAGDVLEMLKENVDEFFPKINDSSYSLSYLPEALQIPNNLAYYLSSPIDNTSRNIIRINGSNVDGDSMLLWTTMAHEGYPGHLYQHQYFMQHSFAYDIETLIGSIGTSEGWAYYVEKLALDWLDIDPVVADAYFTDQIMGMAIISVVDIGVNYEGWGIDETADFLRSYYGAVPTDTCQAFIDTCANDPGTYLPYSVGYYQTDDLFEEISDSYPSDKEMYDAYLKLGSMPFTLLKHYLIPEDIL